MTNKQLKIASININRILLDSRKKLLLNYCLDQNLDVVGLQEVRFQDGEMFEPNYTFISNSEPERGGTGMLIRKEIKISNIIRGGEGRILCVKIENINFVNIYAPAGSHWKEERNVFFQTTLPPFIQTCKSPTLLFGDFNAVDSTLDRTSGSNNSRESVCKALINLVNSLKLTDMWKRLQPGLPGHTYFHQDGSSRLDRFYANEHASTNVTAITTRPTSFSDHHSVEISLTVLGAPQHKQKKRTFIWKLNTSVIGEEEYDSRVSTFIENARNHSLRDQNIRRWWDEIFKPGIKKISVDYCRQRTQLLKSTRAFFQQCLSEMATTNPDNIQEFRNLQIDSRSWEENHMKGVAIRAKVPGYSTEETPTTYHISKERKTQAESNITALNTQDGRLLTKSSEISLEIENHFRKIFDETPSSDPRDNAQFLQSVQPRVKLSQEKCDMLTRPIEKAEVRLALDAAKKNKSPGVDGIPSEFYAAYWNSIGDDMVAMMNAVLKNSATTTTQSLALVKLVPKIGKPKTIVDYRPISLLCADYKLIASTLARRLSKTLPDTISPQQRGGVPGRRIEKNLTLVRDVSQFLEERNCEGAVIAVDFSKAYDLVNREIVWSVMKKMGYPITFISHLQALYQSVNMQVLYGEGITQCIHGRRSIRQGCPLSTQLFAIYLEPLLARLDLKLSGIPVFNQKAKSFAYVDDVNIFVGTEKDVSLTITILREFCNWTGAVVNEDKTYIMGLGAWKSKSSWKITWAKLTSSIKLLGIVFYPTVEETTTNAWAKVLGIVVASLRESSSRIMTIHQKVRLIKENILNKAIYVARILPCPAAVADKILTRILSFLWQGSVERTKKSVLFKKETEGGLGLPHPELTFRCLLLKSTYNILRGEECVEQRLLDFWLAYPLRQVNNGFKKNSAPYSILHFPDYLKSVVNDAKFLSTKGLLNKEDVSINHRKAYKEKIQEISTRGKLESRLTHLNWTNIWKNTNKLPYHFRDLMFRLNHDVLPTRERQKKTNIRTDGNCEHCVTEIETIEHVFSTCQQRRPIFVWLTEFVANIGFHKMPPDGILRLDFQQNEKTPFVCLAVAIYTEIIWKYRRKGKIPKQHEIERTIAKWKQKI